MKERIVCVDWYDASFNDGYYDRKNPSNFAQVHTRSVGHLVTSKGKDIIISTDRFYCSENHLDSERHISTIPKKMVKKITYLKEIDEVRP